METIRYFHAQTQNIWTLKYRNRAGAAGKNTGGKKGKNLQKFAEKHPQPTDPNEVPYMSDNEKERITEVFKMYETDIRSAAMNPEVSFDI